MSTQQISDLATLRQINVLCDQFESALQSEVSPQIDDYLRGLPPEVSQTVLPQLVALEIDYRKLRGELPSVEDYSQRFGGPDQKWLDQEWLDQLCTISSGNRSTAMEADRKAGESKLASGTRLGDYVIESFLAAGGMGVVYRANHLPMHRQVALKVFSVQDASEVSQKRFRREVEAAARLSHPNVVRAYDAGEHQGLLYLAMELIDGQNLHQHVRRSGPLSVDQSISVIRQAALGLEHAHRQAIVHRDVKPANLLITPAGKVKLLDVGLARMDDRPNLLDPSRNGIGKVALDTNITASGLLMGTIDYLAPEQATEPAQANHLADVYGLGCTWKFLLTGKPCYAHLPMIQRLVAHQVGPAPSIRDECPHFPRDLERLFQRMVAKRPDKRPKSMEEVIEAIDAFELRNSKAKRPLLGRRLPLSLAAACLLVLVTGALAYLGPFRNWRSGQVVDATHTKIPNASRESDDPEQRQKQTAIRLGLPLHQMGPDNLQFILIPPGDFLMGSNDTAQGKSLSLGLAFPQHPVKISKPFYLAQTETTVAQYRSFVEATGYVTRPEFPGGTAWGKEQDRWKRGRYSWKQMGGYPISEDNPVINLTWYDAQAYCDWLNKTSAGSAQYCLPTEAQWEYACRAGSNSRWSHGNDQQQLAEYSWYRKNSYWVLHPVAKKRPNAWGLYDMHGNAAEWCADRFAGDFSYYDSHPKIDPIGPEIGSERIKRGGNILSSAIEIRSAFRVHQEANEPTKGGFRVAMNVPVDR